MIKKKNFSVLELLRLEKERGKKTLKRIWGKKIKIQSERKMVECHKPKYDNKPQVKSQKCCHHDGQASITATHHSPLNSRDRQGGGIPPPARLCPRHLSRRTQVNCPVYFNTLLMSEHSPTYPSHVHHQQFCIIPLIKQPLSLWTT